MAPQRFTRGSLPRDPEMRPTRPVQREATEDAVDEPADEPIEQVLAPRATPTVLRPLAPIGIDLDEAEPAAEPTPVDTGQAQSREAADAVAEATNETLDDALSGVGGQPEEPLDVVKDVVGDIQDATTVEASVRVGDVGVDVGVGAFGFRHAVVDVDGDGSDDLVGAIRGTVDGAKGMAGDAADFLGQSVDDAAAAAGQAFEEGSKSAGDMYRDASAAVDQTVDDIHDATAVEAGGRIGDVSVSGEVSAVGFRDVVVDVDGDGNDDLGGAIRDAVDGAKGMVDDTVTGVGRAAEDAADFLGANVEDAAAAAGQAFDDASAAAGDVYRDTAEQIQQTADDIHEATAVELGGHVGGASVSAEVSAVGFRDVVVDVDGDGNDDLGGAIRDAVDAAGQIYEDATDAAGQMFDDAADAAADAVGGVVDWMTGGGDDDDDDDGDDDDDFLGSLFGW